MKNRYELWLDAMGDIIEFPPSANVCFDNLEDAREYAYDFVQDLFGEDVDVIVHIEDLLNEETIDTIEQINCELF